ncbi:hypothetical protein Cgig2_022212 [Carnegiea gigantea]|uniref:Uncharacterized protein n=1 Tax=Carnegiea gigantea TaxID=171969 RepID=A0A9Q1KA17_9CARY|nr:hypothetical protein Cgig2_022212 [Carnegiea gigantea]
MPNVASKDVEDKDIQVASKLKNGLIQDVSTPYKQALLSYPNDNNLKARRSANEAVEEDGEEIDSTLRSFGGPFELELQFHEKSERCKPSNRGKKSGSKNTKLNHESLTPTEIAKEALDFGKRFGISIIGNEAPVIRRIRRSLRKELENNRQSKG